MVATDGPAMVGLARWFAIALLAMSCHHDPQVDEPAGTPPLPPASGTPVGFLIDDADLHLSADQLGQLRDIDTSLAAQLESIDKESRTAAKAAAGSDASQAPPQQMGRHGRRGMGGMGGGGTGGSGGHHRGNGTGSATAAASAGKLADERTEDVKVALERALALLDAAQQTRAKRILSDHDVDLDLDVAPTAAEPPALPPPPPTLPPPPPTLPPPPPTLPPPSQVESGGGVPRQP